MSKYNFQEIDEIISLLNPKNAINLNKSSSKSSEYDALCEEELEIIDFLNNDSNRSSSSSSWFSTGSIDSQSLISYKSVERNHKAFSKRESIETENLPCNQSKESDQEVMDLLVKQHSLVNQLNHENIKLIKENKQLKSQLESKNSTLKTIQEFYDE